MSVLSVCHGQKFTYEGQEWARRTKCLFTIVDKNDEPKLVVEFFSGFDQPFRPEEEEHQRLLKPLLHKAGIAYITISNQEFSEISDPEGRLDFFHWLKGKFEEDPQLYKLDS